MEVFSRRSFVATAAAGIATFASAGSIPSSAQTNHTELKTEWNFAAFDAIVHRPAQVKQLFDSVSASIWLMAHVLNSLNSLQFGFGLAPDQIQLVAVSRGPSTLIDFDDYVWKTYNLGTLFKINDPTTGKPAERNIFYAGSPATANSTHSSNDVNDPGSIFNNDRSMQTLQQRGVQFLCCHNSVVGLMNEIIEQNHLKQTQEQVYGDVVAHLLPGTMMVPAAVGAMAFLQSKGGYGYTYIS
ncbi:MAG: hypothetical protein ACP5E5_02625 [Acidobacteriaceae bacterium]